MLMSFRRSWYAIDPCHSSPTYIKYHVYSYMGDELRWRTVRLAYFFSFVRFFLLYRRRHNAFAYLSNAIWHFVAYLQKIVHICKTAKGKCVPVPDCLDTWTQWYIGCDKLYANGLIAIIAAPTVVADFIINAMILVVVSDLVSFVIWRTMADYGVGDWIWSVSFLPK